MWAFKPHDRNAGLTLIELMIAMAIFAIMAVSMFIAFDNVQTAKEVTDQASARLKAYQSAFSRIGQDLQQIIPRPVRDEYGDMQYALRLDSDSSLHFTRAGWTRSAFFSKNPRSNLQRVQYYLEDGKLMRAHWKALDLAPGEQPKRSVLLEDVSELKFRFFYFDLTDPARPEPKTIEEWPPSTLLPSTQPEPTFLPPQAYIITPKAIEIMVTTADMGLISRSYLVADGADEVFK